MSLTKTFRFNKYEDRLYVEEALNIITNKHKEEISIQGDALFIMAKIFNEGIASLELKEIPSSVQYVLNQITCDLIEYDPSKGYFCNENFQKNHKGDFIGKDDEVVIKRCTVFCPKSKQLAIEKTIQKQLRRTNLKKLLDLRKILINLTQELNLAQIYICKENLLEGHSLTVCIDGIHMECPLEDDDSVSVIEHCYNQVDPITMNPPCRYLIDPHIKVRIDLGEKATEIIKDLAQLEQQTPDIKQDAKIIDVEVINAEVIEPEAEIEPE